MIRQLILVYIVLKGDNSRRREDHLHVYAAERPGTDIKTPRHKGSSGKVTIENYSDNDNDMRMGTLGT